jgi:hypothetical protein
MVKLIGDNMKLKDIINNILNIIIGIVMIIFIAIVIVTLIEMYTNSCIYYLLVTGMCLGYLIILKISIDW